MNVEQFAKEINVTLARLLEQLQVAGVPVDKPEDTVSEQDKTRLLNYLRRKQRAGEPNASITVTRCGQFMDSVPIGAMQLSKSTTLEENFTLEEDLNQFKHIAEDTLAKSKEISKAAKAALHEEAVLHEKSADELQYEWPSADAIKPFPHQVITTKFLINNERAFCLNDMGTGKTLSVLWAYDYLRRQNRVHSMLVVCPLSTMNRTWANEIRNHFRGILRYRVIHGADGYERRRALADTSHIYIINHDGLKVAGIIEALADRKDIDLIVIDELAQVARTGGTSRFKALMALVNRQTPRRAWGLTGTPIPNGPADVWAQCRLITPNNQITSSYFNKFKEYLEFRQVELATPRWDRRNWKRITHILEPRLPSDSIELAYQAMQPSIRFKRDECIKLPPLTLETRQVALSKEQSFAYREMLVRLRAEFEKGEITASNELVKANKLLQIACGVPYVDGGGYIKLPMDERLSTVAEIINEAGSKVIVFVPFYSALQVVRNYLSKFFSVDEMSGRTTKVIREQILDRFQNHKNPRVLVAQPASMSHGITLTAANTIIWFSPVWSNDVTTQANCRITRPGQKLNQLIINIEGSPIEKQVYKRLRERGRVQGLLLEMLADKNKWFNLTEFI